MIPGSKFYAIGRSVNPYSRSSDQNLKSRDRPSEANYEMAKKKFSKRNLSLRKSTASAVFELVHFSKGHKRMVTECEVNLTVRSCFFVKSFASSSIERDLGYDVCYSETSYAVLHDLRLKRSREFSREKGDQPSHQLFQGYCVIPATPKITYFFEPAYSLRKGVNC